MQEEVIEVTDLVSLSVEEIIQILKENSVRQTNDCWEWTGSKTGNGYAQFYIKGVYINASKLALVAALERPVEPGMNAFHTCFRRWCVNPAHSEERSAGEIRSLTHQHKRDAELELDVERQEGSEDTDLEDILQRLDRIERWIEEQDSDFSGDS